MKAARAAYESARAVPTWSGRGSCGRESETASAGDGSGTSADRQQPATELPRSSRTTARPLPGPARRRQPSTAVGSVDMDAVLQRFEKTKQRQQSHREWVEVGKSAIDPASRRRSSSRPSSATSSYQAPATIPAADKTLALLKHQNIAERESLQSEATHARGRVGLGAVQGHPASRRRGGQGARPGLCGPGRSRAEAHVERGPVVGQLNRAVIYADPKFDLTEDVVRELNRRYTSPLGRHIALTHPRPWDLIAPPALAGEFPGRRASAGRNPRRLLGLRP